MESAAAVMGAGAALACMPALGEEQATARAVNCATPSVAHARAPVVGFHMDWPYLDPTGLAEPYVPPAGARAGDAVGEPGEQEMRCQFGYF